MKRADPSGVSSGAALYRDSIVADTTAPTPPFASFEASSEPSERVKPYRDAGITFAVFSIVDDFPNSIEQTIRLIARNRQYFLSRPDDFVLVECSDDVRKAKNAGKLAVAFAFQGSNALLGEIALVEAYRRLGVIQMLLAYNTANLAADGCHEDRNAGLTMYGRRLVAEMNRMGVIVDVTHVGLRSSLEALELTHKPPVFSHSTPKKFALHDRNITDEQIRACATKDGVIGLTGLGLFMDSESHTASVAKLCDTIEYVAQLVGARHAAIGLDYILDRDALAKYIRANPGTYGSGSQYPADGYIDFAPPSILPAVAEELLRRRYSTDEVRGILGENYLRVLDANQ